MYYFVRNSKCLVFTVLSALMVNCTSEKEHDVAKRPESKYAAVKRAKTIMAKTNRLSYKEALSIAKNSISIVENKSGSTRGESNPRVIDEKNGAFTISAASGVTKSGNSVDDTLLYVFNFNDNQGFAVVSANRNTESLLAVTEAGSYQPDTEGEITGFNEFMKKAKEYVKNAKDSMNTRGGYNYERYITDTLDFYRIEPKIPVAWGGKGGVAGKYCSNNTAGCGPIAMAQIMTYYQHPSSFTYTFSNRDINYESVNWNLVNQHTHTRSHPLTICNGYTALDNTIGRICRELGSKSRSTYNSDGSTVTSAGAMYDVLTYYNYTMPGFHSIPNDKNCFMNWLDEDKLIIMTGYTQDDIGHIWLVDGGYHIEARTMLIGSNDGLQWHFLRYFMKDSTYNHINWGWDGLCNGFFLYDVFDANNESEYDDGMINEIDDDLNFYRGTKYSLIYR